MTDSADQWAETAAPLPARGKSGPPRGEKHHLVVRGLKSSAPLRRKFADGGEARRYVKVLRRIADAYYGAQVKARYDGGTAIIEITKRDGS